MNFEGSIGEIDLIQRFVELGREHFTGAIRFEQDGIIKIIYFKGGDVLSASTNDRKDAIDEILLRAGKVGREHIKQALAKRQENETLGDALLNLGFITRKELTWARRVQVIGILRSVRAWTDGSYAIVADYLPKRDEGTIFPLPQIIVEFTVTEQDRASFDRVMDGGEAVFHKTSEFDTAFPALDLNEDAAEIVKHIDGEKSAAEIAGVSGAETFNVYKLLEAMRILGLIDKRSAAGANESPAVAIPPPDDFSFGLPDTSTAAAEGSAWTIAPAEVETPPAVAPLEIPPEPQVIPEPLPPPVEAKSETPFALSMPGQSPAVAKPNDKAWGFDEAQLETARRATSPQLPGTKTRPATSVRPARPAKKSRVVPLALIAVALAAIGYGAWRWMQRRSEPAPVVAATPQRKPPVVEQPPIAATTTATTTESASPVTASTATVAPAVASTTTTTTSAAKSRVEKQPAGGRVITNVPTPPAVVDSGRGKYDAMAKQFAQNPSGTYTVQFELVCQTPSLAKAIAAGGSNVWFVPVTYRNQSCYRVFWGHFDSRDAAIAAAARIPAALRGSNPVVVSVPKS